MASNPTTTTIHSVSAPAHNRARRKYRLFFSVNAIVFLLIFIGSTMNPYADLSTGIYVMILFLICTSPSLFITNYRGKASLMLMYLMFYFATFALLDLSNLLAYKPLPPRPEDSLFTGGEIVILIGAVFFMVGYALMLGFRSNREARFLAQDWSPKAIVMYALASWVIGFYANVIIQFGVGDLNAAGKQTLGVFGGFIALARMLDPLGVLMLIYSYLTTRKKAVLIVLVFMMFADFGLGFVADTKEMAVRGPLLFLFSYVILRDRLPIVATVIFVVIAGLTFNVFAAYRDELGTRRESRTHAVANIDSKLDKIAGQNISLGQRLSDGLEYFAGRVTLKQNVELVAAKTGKDVAFQNGKTLTPVLLAFVPRFILPDKQDASEVGRIFNREFFHSGSPNTYIAGKLAG